MKSAVRQFQHVRRGDHVCLIYENFREHIEAIAPVMQEALSRGEYSVYVADEHKPGEILEGLEEAGLDAGYYTSRGALEIFSADDVFSHQPASLDVLMDFLERALQNVVARGFTYMHVSVENSWTLRMPNAARLVECEALADTRQARRWTCCCQYNSVLFPPESICDVLRSHSVVIQSRRCYTGNPYYEPPEVVLLKSGAERYSWMLDQIRQDNVFRDEFERMRAAGNLKDTFMSKLCHELRGPLTVILGWVQLLEASKLNESSASRAHGSIKRNGVLLLRLIEDLFSLSRVSAGKLKLKLEPTDLPRLIQDCIEAMGPILQEKAITMEYEYTSDARDGTVAVDPVRFRQIMGNLLQNAVKFTPGGGRIAVQLAIMSETVDLRIVDTGKGITADLLPRIFDTFCQGQESEEHGGLGLGLTIVRDLVELHGGTIEALSMGPGTGTTFRIRFPKDLSKLGQLCL